MASVSLRIRIPAVLLAACLAAAQNDAYSYTGFAERLNSDLLAGKQGVPYNKHIPPTSNRTNTLLSGGSQAGTDVNLQLRVYKIDSVDAATAHMKLKVWLRLSWVDERLSWNPEDYGNVTSTYFLATGQNKGEETQIWVPDLTIYNLAGGQFNDMLEGGLARVSDAGMVYWSRPGVIEVLCRFSGLVAFPFDNLRCSIEIVRKRSDRSHARSMLTAEQPRSPLSVARAAGRLDYGRHPPGPPIHWWAREQRLPARVARARRDRGHCRRFV